MNQEEILTNYYLNNIEKQLDDKKKEIIRDYTQFGYRDINNCLLDRIFGLDIAKKIQILRDCIKISKNPIDNLVVYHASTRLMFKKCKIIKNNNTYICPSTFISTSISRDIIDEFLVGKLGKTLCVEITIPKDYPMLWVKPLSAVYHENEVLLLDKTYLKVLSYHINKEQGELNPDTVKTIAE